MALITVTLPLTNVGSILTIIKNAVIDNCPWVTVEYDGLISSVRNVVFTWGGDKKIAIKDGGSDVVYVCLYRGSPGSYSLLDSNMLYQTSVSSRTLNVIVDDNHLHVMALGVGTILGVYKTGSGYTYLYRHFLQYDDGSTSINTNGSGWACIAGYTTKSGKEILYPAYPTTCSAENGFVVSSPAYGVYWFLNRTNMAPGTKFQIGTKKFMVSYVYCRAYGSSSYVYGNYLAVQYE